MASVILWWVILEILSLAALPIVFAVFQRLPDRGYAFAKIAGFLLVSYLSWLLVVSGLFKFTGWLVLLALVLVGLASVYLATAKEGQIAREIRSFWSHRRGLVICVEVLFAASYLALVLLRAYGPDIVATEKPMDLAFLNAILRSGTLPPNDPWLSGFPINYYYFGHFSAATLAALSGLPSGIAFNLAIATLFAMTLVGTFGLGFNLAALGASALHTKDGRQVKEVAGVTRQGAAPYWVGFFAALLVGVAGNLYAGFQLLSDPARVWNETWWQGVGWNSSRVLVDTIGDRLVPTINEFPSFSFILADLHPHVMALPLTVLCLALGLEVISREWSARPATRVLSRNAIFYVFTAISLGSLYLTNTWDFPTYFIILTAALFLRLWHAEGRRWTRDLTIRLAEVALPVLALSVVLYAPFHLTFTSLIGSAAPPLPENIASLPLVPRIASFLGVVIWGKTTAGSFLTIFGVFLYILLAFVFTQTFAAWKDQHLFTSNRSTIFGAAATAAIIGLAVVFQFPLLGLAPLVALCLVILLRCFKNPATSFALLLTLVGLILVFVCEVFFLQDVFHDRMNTVFKFYYQAWVIFGVAASFGAWRVIRSRPTWPVAKAAKLGWILGLGVVVGLALVYPVVSARAKTEGFTSLQDLNGVTYLEKADPADYQAIGWLQANVSGSPVILEATGPAYSEYARVSTFTGLPTVLGWANHELQWRGGQPSALAGLSQRAQDVATIYATTDVEQARALLQKYEVEYVYVGPLERSGDEGGANSRPPTPAALSKFADFMDVVYDKDGVTIYRSRNT
ncbi:MAG: DUF2298 domain-containing protein [Chloroflexi bacterium]|nr:DUF2298 domain-containing protein [Chloroflexota bacterium]